MNLPPENLVHIALAHLDPTMLTSPDGKRVEIELAAICRLLAQPPDTMRPYLLQGFLRTNPKT